MKRLLVYGLAGTLLFAVSATVSLWYQQQQLRPKTEAEADAKPVRPPRAVAGKAASPKDAHAEKADADDELRPVVRPPAPPSAEETARLASSLRERVRAVREREEQLNSRQKQLEVIYQDIRGERSVLDELRKQVSDEMRALGEKMASADNRFGELERQRQQAAKTLADVQKRQVEFDGSERKNIDKMASMYDSMQPDSAARILQQLADSGKLDTAVKLLSQMKERQAAKVLAELSDATLAAQLLEKMRGVKRPGSAMPPAVSTSAALPPSPAATPAGPGEIPR